VDSEIGALSDAAMLELAKREVAQLYGLTTVPQFEHVVRIERAIPQYDVGHAERVATVERAASALERFDVTGFGLRGVAFGDAAADGYRTGERIAKVLSSRR
jgi:oxygen-dependent protoporphyrinogen oxidase